PHGAEMPISGERKRQMTSGKSQTNPKREFLKARNPGQSLFGSFPCMRRSMDRDRAHQDCKLPSEHCKLQIRCWDAFAQFAICISQFAICNGSDQPPPARLRSAGCGTPLDLRFVWSLVLGLWCFAAAQVVSAQEKSAPAALDGQGGRQLLLENFRPVPMLKVERHELTKARFPVV